MHIYSITRLILSFKKSYLNTKFQGVAKILTALVNYLLKISWKDDTLEETSGRPKRSEETRKHVIDQRIMLTPEQRTMLGMAKEHLKKRRLDFIKGSGLLSSLM